MSAEHIDGSPESQSSEERREWQGQKWEYLVLDSFSRMHGISPLGKMEPKGLFVSEDVDPVTKHYKNEIKNLREAGNDSKREILNLFGADGWEIVTTVRDTEFEHARKILLLLKRPIITSE
jgi:hypothetical protein